MSLGEYAAYGTLGSYGFLKGAAFELRPIWGIWGVVTQAPA